MKETLLIREVALCGKRRCPILILQEVCSGEEVAVPLGLVEACLLGCALYEGGVGTERCTALLAEALKEANGELVAVELVRAACGRWWAELTFRRGDGTSRSQRCRPADAATLSVAFGVPITMNRKNKRSESSEDFASEQVAHWLATLAPEDFERLGEEPT